jgi:hypothetical protein
MNLLIIKGIYFEAVFKDRADVQKLNRILIVTVFFFKYAPCQTAKYLKSKTSLISLKSLSFFVINTAPNCIYTL